MFSVCIKRDILRIYSLIKTGHNINERGAVLCKPSGTGSSGNLLSSPTPLLTPLVNAVFQNKNVHIITQFPIVCGTSDQPSRGACRPQFARGA